MTVFSKIILIPADSRLISLHFSDCYVIHQLDDNGCLTEMAIEGNSQILRPNGYYKIYLLVVRSHSRYSSLAD
jgi:hypothetical protein